MPETYDRGLSIKLSIAEQGGSRVVEDVQERYEQRVKIWTTAT